MPEHSHRSVGSVEVMPLPRIGLVSGAALRFTTSTVGIVRARI
jgi:hypothetical protein